MDHQSTVNSYIAKAPENVQGTLQELRTIIKQVAPQAIEKISYGMPFYEYFGRFVYFANMKQHIGLYIPPPIIDNHKEELKNYVTTKSSIHFPIHEKLPISLIKKLLIARMKWNEETVNNR